MAVTYFQISYPLFTLGAIIDPEEANQNNYEIVTKINTIVDGVNLNEDNINDLGEVKADITYVDSVRDVINTSILNLAGTGRTVETVRQNSLDMISHRTSTVHDIRYYTKTLLDSGQLDNRYYTETEINDKIQVINNSINTNKDNLTSHKNSSDHDGRYYPKSVLDSGKLDGRYYTKEELIPWLRGGDTLIKEETYVIINPNIDGATFSYYYEGQEYIGTLTESGGQIFELKTGFYQTNQHRIDVTIDDTLRRSVSSGGLVELSETSILLTTPEDAGTEVTVKYFERVGLVAEYNIKLSAEKPPNSGGKNMWFKIIE